MSEIETKQSDTNETQSDFEQSKQNSFLGQQFTYFLSGLIIGIPYGIYLFFFINEGFLTSLLSLFFISWFVGIFIVEGPNRLKIKSKYRNR